MCTQSQKESISTEASCSQTKKFFEHSHSHTIVHIKVKNDKKKEI